MTACSGGEEQLTNSDVHLCVNASWQEGRSVAGTRTISDGILSAVSSIAIAPEDFPQTITLNDGSNDYIFINSKTNCPTHIGYISYLPPQGFEYANGKTYTASSSIDSGKDILSGQATISGGHLSVTLQHTKALLRFAFKVDAKYDKIRTIKVKSVKLNGEDCTMAENTILPKATDSGIGLLIAYTYINPVAATYTLSCTYDVYDKDETTSEHLVRGNKTATNEFNLAKSGSSIPSVVAGKYYDLNITLNPDSLYVLSDHDNKHITIE